MRKELDRRENKRKKFQANVKIGYMLDDIELCQENSCQRGKIISPCGGSFVVDHLACEGRGFLAKK